MKWRNGEYLLSDERQHFDLGAICALLQDTYWAADRPRSFVERAVANSVCLGLFHGDEQIGLARAVTDSVTFTWICDVVIHPRYRGRGLGKWMVKILLEHPATQTRSQVLATRDAHGLYQPFGFKAEEFLKRKLDVYCQADPADSPPAKNGHNHLPG
jgi:GNAT superfamily N-acetyltransferase